MRVTIHQPNFFPWLPFFEKAADADVMVILTHCQWAKGGYQNRFKLADQWYTMPVVQGLQSIADKKYIDPAHAWRKIKGELPEYRDTLDQFDDCICGGLAVTNINIITRIRDLLGLRTAMAVDHRTDLAGSERLLDICLQHGAIEYISGPSGRDYLDVVLFNEHGIDVKFHRAQNKRAILEVL
jgi:hypothetical protein